MNSGRKIPDLDLDLAIANSAGQTVELRCLVERLRTEVSSIHGVADAMLAVREKGGAS